MLSPRAVDSAGEIYFRGDNHPDTGSGQDPQVEPVPGVQCYTDQAHGDSPYILNDLTSVLRDMALELKTIREGQQTIQAHNATQQPVNGNHGDGDQATYVGESPTNIPRPTRVYRGQYMVPHHIKISPYNGKEEWLVWITKFEVVAERYGWSDSEKLDQLLPRLEGQAAQFVYSQLPRSMLDNYSTLTQELSSRFRVIQTPRSFAAKFSRRVQRIGETAEEYANDLKLLYDKAHGYRERQLREEDLVRRFLDGLRDEDIRFSVEYHKEPSSIDEAVYHVVNHEQTKGRKERRDSTRRLPDKTDVDSDCEQFAYTEPKRQVKSIRRTEKGKRDEKTEETESANKPNDLKDLLDRIKKIEDKMSRQNEERPTRGRNRDNRCYNCQEIGHFARLCPAKRQGKQRWREALTVPNGHLNARGHFLAAREGSN